MPGMELVRRRNATSSVCSPPSTRRWRSTRWWKHSPPVDNRPDIFGEQLILDAGDEITGRFPLLLTTASSISVDNVTRLAREYGRGRFSGPYRQTFLQRDGGAGRYSAGRLPCRRGNGAGGCGGTDGRSMRKCGESRFCRIPTRIIWKICRSRAPGWSCRENAPETLIAVLNGDLSVLWGRG